MTQEDDWWDPNDAIFASDLGPHEPCAARRMQLNKWPGPEIKEELNYAGPRLMRVLTNAMDLENLAHKNGRPIHTATINPDKLDPDLYPMGETA